jgi:hypothetical protein
MKAYRMKSWWWGRFVIRLSNGWFFDNGQRCTNALSENDLEPYIESEHGRPAAKQWLEDFGLRIDRESLDEEYKDRVFKQIGENEWQQL